MPRRSSRRQHPPPANRHLQLVSYLLTFVFGFVAGIGGSKMMNGNQATPNASATSASPRQTAELASVIKQIESHLAHAPDDVDARIQLGNAYFDSGVYESAIIQYARALDSQPRNPDVIVDMGISYRRIGQSDVAVKRFREALEIDSRHVNARFNLGLVLQADLRDFAGAIAAWDTLLNQIPDHPNATWIRGQIDQMKQQSES